MSFSWSDITGDSSGDVGFNNDGTVSVPVDAAPVNQPWDSGGGVIGSYGGDLMDILKYGVGVAARNYDTRQMLDYKRFEATQGGAFVQGMPTASAAVTRGGFVITPMLLLVVAGAFLLLKK